MSNKMWDRLLSPEAKAFMVKVGEDEPENVELFFNFLKDRMGDYQTLVVLATMWATLTPIQCANQAVKHAGTYQAGRFIALMDYLSQRFLKGELK